MLNVRLRMPRIEHEAQIASHRSKTKITSHKRFWTLGFFKIIRKEREREGGE